MNPSLNGLQCRFNTFREHHAKQQERLASTYEEKLAKDRQETVVLHQQFLASSQPASGTPTGSSSNQTGGTKTKVKSGNGRGTKRSYNAANTAQNNSNGPASRNGTPPVVHPTHGGLAGNGSPLIAGMPTGGPQQPPLSQQQQMPQHMQQMYGHDTKPLLLTEIKKEVIETNFLTFESLKEEDLKDLNVCIKDESFDRLMDGLITDDFTDPDFITKFLEDIGQPAMSLGPPNGLNGSHSLISSSASGALPSNVPPTSLPSMQSQMHAPMSVHPPSTGYVTSSMPMTSQNSTATNGLIVTSSASSISMQQSAQQVKSTMINGQPMQMNMPLVNSKSPMGQMQQMNGNAQAQMHTTLITVGNGPQSTISAPHHMNRSSPHRPHSNGQMANGASPLIGGQGPPHRPPSGPTSPMVTPNTGGQLQSLLGQPQMQNVQMNANGSVPTHMQPQPTSSPAPNGGAKTFLQSPANSMNYTPQAHSNAHLQSQSHHPQSMPQQQQQHPQFMQQTQQQQNSHFNGNANQMQQHMQMQQQQHLHHRLTPQQQHTPPPQQQHIMMQSQQIQQQQQQQQTQQMGITHQMQHQMSQQQQIPPQSRPNSQPHHLPQQVPPPPQQYMNGPPPNKVQRVSTPMNGMMQQQQGQTNGMYFMDTSQQQMNVPQQIPAQQLQMRQQQQQLQQQHQMQQQMQQQQMQSQAPPQQQQAQMRMQAGGMVSHQMTNGMAHHNNMNMPPHALNGAPNVQQPQMAMNNGVNSNAQTMKPLMNTGQYQPNTQYMQQQQAQSDQMGGSVGNLNGGNQHQQYYFQ